jgi:hypothetical protein
MTLTIDCHPEFAKIIKELLSVHAANAKCQVQLNFSGVKDGTTLRYTNIEAEEFYKIHINGDNNGQAATVTKKS